MYNGLNSGPMMEKRSLLGESGMEFQPKERKRRSMIEQMNFNAERLAVLHKEITELKQMLDPYIVNVPQCEKEAIMGTGEQNSEMMYSLIRESAMINEMIAYVSDLKRDLQL